MSKLFKTLTTLSLLFIVYLAPVNAQVNIKELDDKAIAAFSENVVFGGQLEREVALDALVRRGQLDVAATLVLALRYSGKVSIAAALSTLAGKKLPTWNKAMLWQEANPEIVPHKSYRDLKLEVLRRIDPNFMRFLGKERSDQTRMKIRLEEIAWGGVVVDGIPSLDSPKLITADEADYMKDDDLIFGVEINGDARAYPLRIMGWHEMFNETIGGVPVALAYCTLCGSGILFETLVEGRSKPLVFGSSGFLYRSNKLMFDRETDSLWNQFTGEPVSGPLVDSGIKLKILPVLITSWEQWKAKNPKTRILSLTTGYRRNYDSGNVYKEYFASPDLMFPAIVRDESKLKRKDYVFGIRDFAVSKAWPISAFKKTRVINDAIGGKNLVLVGNAATRSVRAYQRQGQTFEWSEGTEQLRDGNTLWKISENALTAPDGSTLSRVPGHIAYWFAWDSYLGTDSELYAN
ncbi:hypothetical protein MNBD_ALPHA08-23 [hydrothermal vent metagenome]|uniref:DUF3179 domain-containing protein n=1 Tax=hydrothermal vent metagenome TaxID=652676 RepID=A0A3B0RL73_9ZZZZ